MILDKFHKLYIKETAKEAIVTNAEMLLCNLTVAVSSGINLEPAKAYITSRMLKHIYDKRTAEEYDFILNNLHKIVKYPDHILINKSSKNAEYVFLKKLVDDYYFCPFEITNNSRVELVTCYRVKDSYVEKFEKFWSWKDGVPSS